MTGPSEGPGGDRRAVLGCLAALTLLAAFVRLVDLGWQSLWVDEYLWTLTASLKSLSAIIHRPDGYPPTMALLFRALQRSGLGADWWLRLPSALAGTLSVPVLYAVARRVAPPATALTAAGLLAINPMAVWYSQEAGAYALVMLCGLVATWCLLRLLEGAGPGTALGYALAAGAGFGLHYYFLFLPMAHAPFALRDALASPARRRTWIAAAILAALAIGAWLPLFVADVRGQREQDRGQEFSLLALPYTTQTFVGGFAIGPPVRLMHPAVRAGRTPWSAFGVETLSSAAAILVAAALFVIAIPAPRAGRRLLFAAAIVVPILGPYLNSLLGVGYRPRYALVALPYALLWAAGGLETRRRRLAILLLSAFVVIGLAGLVRSHAPSHRREDNRAAAEYVARGGGGDAVLIGEGADPFERYASGLDRLVALDAPDAEDDAALGRRLGPLLAGRGDLWLISSRPWTEDPEGRVPAWLRSHLVLADRAQFAGVTVERYARGRS
ncbi:MAG TPA: glycosyltransferase family 39 protein [Patescibacteria group bacterium]|nr:glycosyltransferase family 39 protein [Patescibacteria group bacterium]